MTAPMIASPAITKLQRMARFLGVIASRLPFGASISAASNSATSRSSRSLTVSLAMLLTTFGASSAADTLCLWLAFCEAVWMDCALPLLVGWRLGALLDAGRGLACVACAECLALDVTRLGADLRAFASASRSI